MKTRISLPVQSTLSLCSQQRRASYVRNSSSRQLLLPALLWILLILSTLSHAQSNPTIYSPVLFGNYWNSTTNNGVPVAMQAKPSGGTSTVQNLSVTGRDFSRNVFGYGRYFLNVESFSTNTHLTHVNCLVAYDETGIQRIPLTSEADGWYIWRVSWSPDGNQIAWIGGVLTDPASQTYTEYGVYVGDVVRDGLSNPMALTNIRQLVNRSADQIGLNPSTMSWTGDQQYLVYGFYDGYSHICRVTVPTDQTAPQEQEIMVGNVSQNSSSLLYIKACPVAGDNRIAFQVHGTHGFDIWTVNVPSGYYGQSLTAVQVTSKSNVKNAPTASDYDWSPDGATFALTVTPSGGGSQIEKIASTGSGSSSLLLSASKTNYSVKMWRN